MYSQRFYKLVELSCMLTTFSGSSAIHFSLKTRRFYVTPQSCRKAVLTLFLTSCYSLFWIYMTVTLFLQGESTTFPIVLALTFIAWILLSNLIVLHYFHLQIVTVMNQVLHHFQRFQSSNFKITHLLKQCYKLKIDVFFRNMDATL